MTIREADLFSFYLSSLPMVKKAVVYERTADAAIVFDGSRQELIDHILQFRYEDRTLDEIVPQESGRALNQEYKEKLLQINASDGIAHLLFLIFVGYSLFRHLNTATLLIPDHCPSNENFAKR